MDNVSDKDMIHLRGDLDPVSIHRSCSKTIHNFWSWDCIRHGWVDNNCNCTLCLKKVGHNFGKRGPIFFQSKNSGRICAVM